MDKKTDAYLKSAIRRIWRWSAARRICLAAKKCAKCNGKGPYFADHIKPVVAPEKGFETWDVYMARMFDGKLQALCKPCHDAKTSEERKIRYAARRAKKQ